MSSRSLFKLALIICVLAVITMLGSGLAPALAAEKASGQDVTQLLEKAQTLYMENKLEQALRAADEASAQIWSWAPFHIQKIVFTSKKASGYGLYQNRPQGNRYKSGETMFLYIEPKAYGFKNVGPDVLEFAMALDIYLTAPDGRVLWGKENFLNTRNRSHARNREFFINLSLTLGGVPKGNYGVKLVFKDLVKKQRAERTLKIVVQ